MRLLSSPTSLDRAIEEIATHEPIRFRLQPQILGKKGYQAWRNFHFNFELATLAEARVFRQALALFFALMDEHGIQKVHESLSELASDLKVG